MKLLKALAALPLLLLLAHQERVDHYACCEKRVDSHFKKLYPDHQRAEVPNPNYTLPNKKGVFGVMTDSVSDYFQSADKHA